MSDKNKTPSEHHYLSFGMCIGLSVGTAISVALDNISLWMSIGMMIGICIGCTMDHEKQKNAENKNDEKME